MRFSLWTQEWKHSEEIAGNKEKIMANLMNYYKNSSKSVRLLNNDENKFTFSRGCKIVSALALGSEKWCFHTVEVSINDIDGSVQVNWNIDLKLFGLQAGKNAILEECKELVKSESIVS